MNLFFINRKILLLFPLVFILLASSCKEGDGNADYGFGLVYIPQATFSGGLNNQYPIPGGSGEISSLNYIVEPQSGTPVTFKIILGVLRAGKIADAGGFNVDVNVSAAETEKAITGEDKIENAVAMPSSMYEMPNKVAVEAGKNTATFYLSVNANQLLNGTYDGKKLVLAVSINNPTNGYECNLEYSTVLVVIDVDAMRNI